MTTNRRESMATSGKSGGKKASGGAKGRGGIARPVQPDEQLAAVVGSSPLPRSELTKKIWDYIKKNGLQDAEDRRMINADDKLRPIFGGKSQVSMFEMTKLVNQHVS
jgi:upstream activation factor subunit UAF30